MRIVFLGMNTSFSAVHLLALRMHNNVEAVFVTKARPERFKIRLKEWVKRLSGRISTGAFSLEKSCNTYGINYYCVNSVNSNTTVKQIREINPDVICMAGFSEKLDKEVISIAKHGVLNSHTSILPDYRGANPFFWMLKMDKVEPGCTVHKVDGGFDTGSILDSVSFEIFPGCNLNVYNTIASVEGGKLMAAVVSRLEKQQLPERENISLKKWNCRNPSENDMVFSNADTKEQLLWVFNSFSDARPFFVKSEEALIKCVKVSAVHFPGCLEYKVKDGVIYILPA